MKSRNERIGVLGGSFDPVHNAHVALGEAALKEAGLRKLIVMPARIQPFKQNKKAAAKRCRLEMTKLAFQGRENVEVSDYELSRDGVSYTVKTLEYLRGLYPDDEIFFICGTDSFLEIESWHMGREILADFSLAVSVRPGYREDELTRKIEEYEKKYGTNVVRIKAEMPPISSTMVRNRLAEGESVRGLVPDEVEEYVSAHGLYRED